MDNDKQKDLKEVDQLYEIAAKLNAAGDEVKKHQGSYQAILAAVKDGGKNAKKLSCQFIPKYFKHFPELEDEAMEALTKLCEEDDLPTRVSAIRGLCQLAKDNPPHIFGVADLLAQLLQSDDQLELDNVKHATVSILQIDPKATLEALFNHIVGGENNLREKVLLFFKEKLVPILPQILQSKPDVEKYLYEQTKKVLLDVSAGEFKVFLEILRSLKMFEGDKVIHLMDIIVEQAELSTDFSPYEEKTTRINGCIHLALPFMQKGASNSAFLNYLNEKVMPEFDKLTEYQKLTVLRDLAEISPFTNTSDAKSVLPTIYSLVQLYIPTKKSSGSDELKINFSFVECILFTLHQIASKCPAVLKSICGANVGNNIPEKQEKLASSTIQAVQQKDNATDFQSRIRCLEENTMVYVKELDQAAVKWSSSSTSTSTSSSSSSSSSSTIPLNELNDKKEEISRALKTTKNIQTMAQALLRLPLHLIGKSSHSQVHLSWVTQNPVDNNHNKRGAETATTANKKTRIEGKPQPVPPKKGGGVSGGNKDKFRKKKRF